MTEWRYNDSHQAWQWEQKAESSCRTGGGGYIFSKPVSSDALTPSRLNRLNLPKQCPQGGGASVQMSETVGAFLIQATICVHVCVCMGRNGPKSTLGSSTNAFLFESRSLSG